MTSAASFQSELLGKESLLWSGQPELRVVFHKEDLLAIPCSLMWGCFATLSEIAALTMARASHNQTLWFGAAWGLPFVLVGQYLVWGRFLYISWKKSRTFYAVTSERILFCRTKPGGRIVSSLDLFNLGVVQKSVRADGIGTLRFDYPHVPQPNALRFLFGPKTAHDAFFDPLECNGTLAFVDIPNAENVYHTLMEAKERLETANGATEAGFLHVN
jgi:hypothetical protein